MDKIIVKNIKTYAYHGVLAEEKSLGQNFYVDVELRTSTKKAGESDLIDDSINYAEVYSDVKAVVKGKSYNLIEALAESIASYLLDKYEMESIKVQVRKPEAPIDGEFDYVAVEIERFKNEKK